MRSFFLSILFCVAAMASTTATSAETDKDKRIAKLWNESLNLIDEAASPLGLIVDGGCVFASGACDKAQKFALRLVIKYQRLAVRSWRARGIKLPAKCLAPSLDGAQIDRFLVAYDRAKGQLNFRLYSTAYDLMGYGLMPWSDLECQSIMRQEIFRVRKLVIPETTV